MHLCPNCGRDIRPGDRFCLHCGQRLSVGFVPPWPWGQAPAEGSAPEAAVNPVEMHVATATPSSEQMRPSMSQPPRFNWKTADGADHDFEMSPSEIAIGRAPTCDIVLNDDQMVSRRHALVRRQGNTITVVDLGSSNGTLINGVEIHDSAPLKDGDRLTIGDHDLHFTMAKEGSQSFAPVVNGSAPVFETIRIGGTSTPLAPQSPNQPLPQSFMMPTPSQPAPIFDAFVEQDTGALAAAAGQQQSSYVHMVNGKEVEREESASSFASQFARESQRSVIEEAPREPARPDAAALLSNIQTLHQQLNEQIVAANGAAEHIRSGIRTALNNLDDALRSAQSAAHQTAITDMRQLADNVGQTQTFDLAANFARRAPEIRDVLTAHQQLLDALAQVRSQLEQTLN